MIKAKHLLTVQKSFVPITLLCVFLNQNSYTMDSNFGSSDGAISNPNSGNAVTSEVVKALFANYFMAGDLEQCHKLVDKYQQVDFLCGLNDHLERKENLLTVPQSEMAKLLIEHGAQLNSYDCGGKYSNCQYAAILAAHNGNLKNVEKTELNNKPAFVWVIEENGQKITQYSRSGASVIPVQSMVGSFAHIAVAPQGSLWRVDTNGDIYFKEKFTFADRLDTSWHLVSNTKPIKQLIVDSENKLWSLDENGDLWTRPGFTQGDWKRVIVQLEGDTKLKHIALASFVVHNEMWGIDDQGRIWYSVFNKNANGIAIPIFWQLIDSEYKFDQIVIGLFGAVCARTTDNILMKRSGINLHNPSGNDWQIFEDLGKLRIRTINVTPQGEFWVVDNNNNLLRRAGVTPQSSIGTEWYKVSLSDSNVLREERFVLIESFISQPSTPVLTPDGTPSTRRAKGGDSPAFVSFTSVRSLIQKAGSKILSRKTNTTTSGIQDVIPETFADLTSSCFSTVSSPSVIALAGFNVVEQDMSSEEQQKLLSRTPPNFVEIQITSDMTETRCYRLMNGEVFHKDAFDEGKLGSQLTYANKPLKLVHFFEGVASNYIWGTSPSGEIFYIEFNKEGEDPVVERVDFPGVQIEPALQEVFSESVTPEKAMLENIVPLQMLMLGKNNKLQLLALGSDGKIYVRWGMEKNNPRGYGWLPLVDHLGGFAIKMKSKIVEEEVEGKPERKEVLVVTFLDGREQEIN